LSNHRTRAVRQSSLAHRGTIQANEANAEFKSDFNSNR
jgi:hypothetical protein